LKICIESSLREVNHQIWLLRNILWSYLLPLGVAVEISIFHSAWQTWNSSFAAVVVSLVVTLVIGLLYWGIYWLNQFAVRQELEPRREELEALLRALR
jgi:ABC-type proline/glycine betaine transport system permease subunit